MTITEPYPAELLRTARKVVWYNAPEETLRDLKTFLAHLMVYGSPTEIATVEHYIPRDEFRKVLEDAPAGVFTAEAWARWHERLGITPLPPPPGAASRMARSDRNRAPFFGPVGEYG